MNGIKLSALFFLIGTVAVVTAAPKGTRGKRSPQMPDMPPFPPPPPGGIPMLDQQAAELFTRVVRQAPPVPQSVRVERQAPEVPSSPPKRVVRDTMNFEAEKPKHLRQETLYSSVTTLSRKKRGTRG